MHVGRHLNRFFGSFRRRKTKETPVAMDKATGSTSRKSLGPAVLLKKTKESSLSRCQLLESWDSGDDRSYCYCESDETSIINPEKCRRCLYEKEGLVHLPRTTKIPVELYQSTRFPPSSSQLHLTVSQAKQPKSNGCDNDIFIIEDENSWEQSTNSPVWPADGHWSNEHDRRVSSMKAESNTECYKEATEKKSALVPAANILSPAFRLTLMQWRKSTKRIRKAVGTGFVDWAESMSHYSMTVMPELYECPSSADRNAYYEDSARFEQSSWYCQHPHYHVEQRCHRQALQANHVNQMCQMSY